MIFVFDLDGTICFKGQPISDRILNCLSSLSREGHEVIFASARPIRDMLPVINKAFHHFTMIGGNGSLISKEGKIVHSSTFSNDDLITIKSLIETFNATYLIDGKWDYAYTGPSNHPILQNVDPKRLANLVDIESLSPIVKILFLTADNMTLLAEKLSKLDIFIHIHHNENVLDISPRNVNKWSALKTLGIQKSSYIAFGNDANDITMFENAYHTVMIGYHDKLSQFAKDMISVNGNYEQEIINKITALSSHLK